MRAAPLPFTIGPEDGHWIALALKKKAQADGLRVEQVLAHVGTPDRLVVFSAPRSEDQADGVRALAHRLQGLFVNYRCTDLTEQAEKKFGYAGWDLRFELRNDKQDLECELFAFAGLTNRWGVLHVRPRGAPVLPTPVFGVLHQRAAPPPGVVAMAPLRVHRDPLTTFPIGLGIKEDPFSGRISAIVVKFVPRGSPTESDGVQVGDIVLAIDGRKTADFSGGIGRGSALGRIFLDRNPGDTVTLKLRHPGARDTYTVTLHVPSGWSRGNPFNSFHHGR